VISDLARWLIAAGAVLLLAGVVLLAVQRLGIFSWVGHLPGDIRLEGRNWTFYFPLTTCILLSVLLTLVVALIRLWSGR